MKCLIFIRRNLKNQRFAYSISKHITFSIFTEKQFDIFSNSSNMSPTDTVSGEMAEQAEGAPLLREYRVKKLYRGFESLSHRHLLYHAPVAQLDRVLGYEPSGQRFESSRVRHFIQVFCFLLFNFNIK